MFWKSTGSFNFMTLPVKWSHYSNSDWCNNFSLTHHKQSVPCSFKLVTGLSLSSKPVTLESSTVPIVFAAFKARTLRTCSLSVSAQKTQESFCSGATNVPVNTWMQRQPAAITRLPCSWPLYTESRTQLLVYIRTAHPCAQGGQWGLGFDA